MMDQQFVTRVQQRLKELLIYTGQVDGRMGPLTIAAIRGFQRINGLKQDGIPGPMTALELWPAPIHMPLAPSPKIKVDTSTVRNLWPRQKDVPEFFGEVGKNQVTVKLPYRKWLAWDLRKSVNTASYHEKVAASALRVHERILAHYGMAEIDRLDLDVTGGTLAVRKMRGGDSWSMHSWGIAEDTDPARNQLKWGRNLATLDNKEYDAYWGFWEDEGWVSLGRMKNYDWMHVQAARL